MTPARFRELVIRLEALSSVDPGGYRFDVVVFAGIGYAYVLLILALAAAAIGLLLLALVRGGSGGLLTVKALIFLAALAFIIVRALWVRIPLPEGYRIHEADAPGLFQLIERLRTDLQSPQFHRVLLTNELNAAIVQTPRLGILGWHSNTLIIGLPLLEALTPAEFTAVLAHEMGHLSGNHGRLSAWIYRIRNTWGYLRHQLNSTRHWLGDLVFTRFINWYEPEFAARSFVLARAHEYEADRRAVEAAGRESAQRSLLRISVISRYLEERYWPAVYRGVAQTPEPVVTPFRNFVTSVRESLAATDASGWLDQAWRRPTDFADTHPALADRLRAMGWTGDCPTVDDVLGAAEPPGSAAAEFLGGDRERLITELDEQWKNLVAPQWKAEHETLGASRIRLQELDSKPALESGEEWERIQLLLRLGEEERSQPLGEEALRRFPDHPDLLVFRGARLLEEGNPRGVDLMKRAAELDSSLMLAVNQRLFEHFWNRGERERAEQYRAEYDQRADQLVKANQERTNLQRLPLLVPHELSPALINEIREKVRAVPDVKEVYLARRIVEHLPEVPCYLVGVEMRTRLFRLESPERAVKVRDAVFSSAPWPQETYAVALISDNRRLRRRMRKVAGSRLMTPG